MEPRILFLLAPTKRDSTGLLRSVTRAYAAAFLKRGYLPLFQEADSANLLDEIAVCVAGQNVKAIFSAGSWGLDTARPDGKDPAAVLSRLGIPVIHTIADPPFASWILPKLRCGFPMRLGMTVDRSFARYLEGRSDVAGKFIFSPPSVYDFSVEPLVAPAPIVDRDIEMSFAGVVLDFEGMRQRYCQQYTDNQELLDAIVETALWDYRTPLIDIGQAIFDSIGRPYDPLNEGTGFLLEVCDWIVRNRRRYTMLAQLAKYPMVIVTRFPHRLPKVHPDTRVIKNMEFRKLLELTKRVKIMPISQPTYTDGITERTLYAMNYGCVVATSTNNELERAFRPNEDLVLFNADFSNADDVIDRLRDTSFLRRLSENAHNAVTEKYSLDVTVDRYIQAAREVGLDA